MKPAPTSGRMSRRQPQRARERERDQRRAERAGADAITRPSPTTDGRDGEVERAAERAHPGGGHQQAERVRRRRAARLAATAGISTVYGMPIVLTRASRSSTVRIGDEPGT